MSRESSPDLVEEAARERFAAEYARAVDRFNALLAVEVAFDPIEWADAEVISEGETTDAETLTEDEDEPPLVVVFQVPAHDYNVRILPRVNYALNVYESSESEFDTDFDPANDSDVNMFIEEYA